MQRSVGWKIAIGSAAAVVGPGLLVVGIVSCGTAPTPFLVNGPGQLGNDPPSLTITEPVTNITRGQGDPFLIRWNDEDPDDNAQISFALVNTVTNQSILLVSGLDENDLSGPTMFTVATSLIPVGTYNILGTISDGTNTPVEVFASSAGTATTQRIVVTIVGEGEGPQTVPPVVTVIEPRFNLSVSQDDVLRVVVQPNELAGNQPFDPDSEVTLYILLDLDLDPNNDDPANPDPTKIIPFDQVTIAPGSADPVIRERPIDLSQVPPRPAGEPYFIRATADDGTNPRVHQYAVGTINVVQLASGTVDLSEIGRTKSGATFQGFNPGANVGSSASTVTDFDADGVDDFVIVAQFGNPQNVGPVGEAYLIYGQDRVRFGGTISVNSVAESISGVLFQAPPIRSRCSFPFFSCALVDPAARTDGITHVSFVRDLTQDGRPELLFGLPHVHGAFDSMDYDPQDADPGQNVDPIGCYPDLVVNNWSDETRFDPFDVQEYAGGMAVMVNSQNRDNNGLINLNRLESTAVSLELTGQWMPFGALETGDISDANNITVRADNSLIMQNLGNDPQEPGRISGSRFIAGGFDFVDPFVDRQPAREGLWGQQVASIGDLNSDGLDEIVISAPRNERYLSDLESTFGLFSTHLVSTTFFGSITVLPGINYNQLIWRGIGSDTGTAQIPFLDQQIHGPFGSCTPTNLGPRHYDVPVEGFEIFAEGIDDMLGGAGSAGDYNQDGLDDILCGAPRNDRTATLPDSGAAYIIYGRTAFGQVNLRNANDPVLRTPMLRIRGLKRGDGIGWKQTRGLDVNGDRIDDVFIASPTTDFGGVNRSSCAGDFDGNGAIDNTDLSVNEFNDCRRDFGDHVFTDDACKAFDYDNDTDIDDDDRCVFCCLSGGCSPDDDCIFGRNSGNCCADLVDNGFVGVVFGGVFTDGDRDISQIATPDLPGVIFRGTTAGDRAGVDVASAGDFNQDGFGDLLIAVPGERRCDRTVPEDQTCDAVGRERLGVVYMVFGGTHLRNRVFDLNRVGTEELPGMIFLSPFVIGRPNEAAPTTVAFLGDINNDGFGDIMIGNPTADFIDPSFPQGPSAPGSDAQVGRRRDAGQAYIVYGNNFGTNRGAP